MNWDYMQPVKIKFGCGTICGLGKITGQYDGEGILVCGSTLMRNGVAERIMQENSNIKLVFSHISPNPDTSEVDECAELIRSKKIKFVVAVGGGSVMDCAKAAATIAMTNDTIRKYHGTGVALPKQHLPLIAVPTTSGTGSEVTCVSVLTDRSAGKKAPIVSDNFYPEYAIVDPELTYSVPLQITANTGMDVLAHAVEGFWSKGHQPVCDACALHASELVFEYLPSLYRDPENKTAREKLSEASLMAGLAFSIPKTTAPHACSFPLTNIYHIPHGEACALTLDYFTVLNKDVEDGRLQKFAGKLGFSGADAMAERILEMKKEMNMRTDLKEFHLTDHQIDDLVKISRHPNLYNNPVEVTDEMLYQLYNSLR